MKRRGIAPSNMYNKTCGNFSDTKFKMVSAAVLASCKFFLSYHYEYTYSFCKIHPLTSLHKRREHFILFELSFAHYINKDFFLFMRSSLVRNQFFLISNKRCLSLLLNLPPRNLNWSGWGSGRSNCETNPSFFILYVNGHIFRIFISGYTAVIFHAVYGTTTSDFPASSVTVPRFAFCSAAP